MSTPRLRDPMPVPTDFEIDGPFFQRICWAARALQFVLAALAFGGASLLVGFFGRLAGYF